jgi:hypothetical protein
MFIRRGFLPHTPIVAKPHISRKPTNYTGTFEPAFVLAAETLKLERTLGTREGSPVHSVIPV